MKTLSIAVITLALATGVGRAQHTGHTGPSAELVAACVDAQRQVGVLAEEAIERLETARQSNSPQEMRAAVADLQAALVEIRTRAAECAPLEAAAEPADPHAGHRMREPAANLAMDPVCSKKVDSKTAPQASYEGETYHICSDAYHENTASSLNIGVVSLESGELTPVAASPAQEFYGQLSPDGLPPRLLNASKSPGRGPLTGPNRLDLISGYERIGRQ